MSSIHDTLIKYAREAERVEDNGTGVGYYTHLGLLATFLDEVTPLIEAKVREELSQAETPEAAALRIAAEHPDRSVAAIKDYRTWLKENGHPYGLKEAKDAIDAARTTLSLKLGLHPTLEFGGVFSPYVKQS